MIVVFGLGWIVPIILGGLDAAELYIYSYFGSFFSVKKEQKDLHTHHSRREMNKSSMPYNINWV